MSTWENLNVNVLVTMRLVTKTHKNICNDKLPASTEAGRFAALSQAGP